MTPAEHMRAIERGDIRPRIVEHKGRDGTLYVAWTPTREGPGRPDYPAALADLTDTEGAMAYAVAKAAQQQLGSEVEAARARVEALRNAAPIGPTGLTADSVKASPEWRAARAAYDLAFANLRRFNGQFVKTFAKEIRAERTRILAGIAASSEKS